MMLDLFRWRSTLLLTALLAIGLYAGGWARAAAGVPLGFLLYAMNVFLLCEITRSLAAGRRGVHLLLAISSSGRLLLLGAALAAIAWSFGRQTLLGACGGLLVAQINLHRLGRRGRPANP